MSRAFFAAVEELMEALVYMSVMARQDTRDEWQGTPESNRDDCAQALESLRSVWNQDPGDMAKLDEMVSRCLQLYAQNDVDGGGLAIRDIDEFLSGVRRQAAAAKTKPR
jgi:hypothetical protein